jgi:hypothetical protein
VYQANWQKINNAALAAQKALQTCNINTGAADSTVTASAAALANGATALTTLGTIQSAFIASASAGGSDQTVAINKATTDYQAFLAASSTPSASDIQTSADQSTDSADASPVSLYTQMTQLAAQAKCSP